MKVNIIDLDHKGNGMARIDNKVIFIPKCITGDIVDINIVKSHKKYDDGRVKEVIEESEDRIDSLCPYYDICGGCNIGNLNYGKQLEYKKNKVINIFKRYIDMEINPEIIGSMKEFGYRNKITYHKKDFLGLVSIDNQVIDILECKLVSERVNELFRLIKREDISLVNEITIRECQNGLILSVNGQIDIKNLKDNCIMIYVNNQVVFERERPYLMIGDIKYFVSEKAFFQVNTANIKNLYDIVVKYGEFNQNDRVIDLYCGVGSISLYIAKYVNSVLGIEIVEEAIRDARENALVNGIMNADFRCGAVGILIDECRQYDKVIVDPPRAGLDQHTVSILNSSLVERIVYVSCDPMTLVRDIKLLDNYQVTDITLVDMFPQTHHVESVILLQRKK